MTLSWHLCWKKVEAIVRQWWWQNKRSLRPFYVGRPSFVGKLCWPIVPF
jgi:hypothetical protein